MPENSKVLKGYLSVFSGDLGRLLVFAVFIPILVRVVGESGFGIYALVMALFLPLRKILNLGLFEATKTYASRSEGDRQAIIATSLVLHLGVLLLGIPILYLAISYFATSPPLRNAFYYVLGALVGEQLYYFGRGVLHASNRESIVEPLIPLRSIILAVVGLVLAEYGFGVAGVFAGFATGFLITGIVSAVLALREAGPFRLPHSIGQTASTLLAFGIPSMVLILLNVSLYKVDILLVSYYTTAAETGYYRAALQVAEFIWVVSIGMEMVMIQSTADLWVEEQKNRITELLSQFLKFVIVFTTLLLVGVFTLGETFLTVYFGSSFSRSILPLWMLLPGVFGFAIARGIWPVMQAGGYLRLIVSATGTAVLLNIILNLILIPPFGLLGAAAATSISYCLMAMFHTIVARVADIRPLSTVPVFRIGVVGLITGVPLYVIEPLTPWYLDLGLLPLLGLAIYSFGILKLNILTRTEIAGLLDSLGITQ